MPEYLFSSALGLYAQAVIPLLVAVLVGAIVMGIIQAMTLVRDPSLGFVGRLGAVMILCVMASGMVSSPVLEFAKRMWGGADLFR